MIRLGHVNIRTSRFDETIRFFEKVLGFRVGPSATNPDMAENVWLSDADGRPSIHINRAMPGEAEPAPPPGYLNHIAFDCTDEAAMADRLSALGFAYRRVENPSIIQFNLHDPNGIKVELTFPRGDQPTR